MTTKHWMTTAVLCLAWTTAAAALDQIKTTDKARSVIRGHILSMSAQEVEIESTGGLAEKVPVNKITYVVFDDETPQMMTIREYMSKGQYAEAVAALEKLPAEDAKSKNIAAELEYFKAICAARMALGGNGSVEDAVTQIRAFVKKYPTSFHFYEAHEILGNLAISARSYDRAVPLFGVLAKAPWPDYTMRANVGIAKALLAQNKTAEASKAFDEVLNSAATGDLAEEQRLAAQLGKARCMAANQKAPAAIKVIEGIIAKTDPENADLMAQAYSTLGAAQRKAGNNKEAIFAYLHVDLLYATLPDAHAEALANLAELFSEEHKPDKAARVRAALEDQYPNSPWATKGK